ncbi:hypothetical protein H2199_003595 [Coniosporium tulheliwenetii]|uniref:Uncharacterized protein n=1 Tax=Coniosporium tulheliwenetii TaxID=3383036 RepID=A0ACC2ZA99_9PEZI|nr:hypothetical protein H2199_003595 [Cladosporium sp. JES 115]
MASSSSSSTPLLYSCIAYNTTILTEHTASASSQASSLASLVLPKIPHSAPTKQTYTHAPPPSTPSAASAGGLSYLVICKAELGRRIPFGYLISIKDAFLKQYDPQTTDFAALPPYGAAAFNATLKRLMHEQGATEAGQNDAIKTAQREIASVREVMEENIERVLERGERIDLLVDKTDRLGEDGRDVSAEGYGHLCELASSFLGVRRAFF